MNSAAAIVSQYANPPVTVERRARVFELTRSLLKKQTASEIQKQLIGKLLDGLETASRDEPLLPFVDIPVLVHAAVVGTEEEAYPLAAATTLLYLGIDTLDDLADGDQPEQWKGFALSEINLAATTLLSTLPQIIIGELKMAPGVRLRMLKELANRLLIMSAGQQADIRHSGKSFVSAEAVEKSVMEKSGEELALFAALASLFAEANPELVETYATFGREIGTAGQLASDCHDLFQAAVSRDLAQETRTLPIALYLEKKGEGERAVLLDLLRQKNNGNGTLHKIRDLLHESGLLRITSFIVELHCQRAIAALDKAAPLESARTELHEAINNISFYPKRRTL